MSANPRRSLRGKYTIDSEGNRRKVNRDGGDYSDRLHDDIRTRYERSLHLSAKLSRSLRVFGRVSDPVSAVGSDMGRRRNP
jgi:hypothetical protein